MFSYGMVLYELVSGRRPVLGQHQLQIAKKLSKGVRPALGSPEEVQFCCLHSLLTECWDTRPEKVTHQHTCSPQMYYMASAAMDQLSLCVCVFPEAGGGAVCEADAGAQLPLPQVHAVLRQPLAALPVAAAGTQRRVLERRQRRQVSTHSPDTDCAGCAWLLMGFNRAECTPWLVWI